MACVSPLVVAVAASVLTLFFWVTEVNIGWKILATVLMSLSIILMFVPGLTVHYAIPWLIQLFLIACLFIYFKMTSYL